MGDLTNLQKFILCEIYKAYLEKQPAISSIDANNFDSAEEIYINYLTDLDKQTVIDTCISLKSKGYLNGSLYDNSLYCISISEKSIIYFENHFTNNIKKLIKFILNLKF